MKDSLDQVTDSLSELAKQLKRVALRVDKHRSHKVRNALLVLGGAGLAVGVVVMRLRRTSEIPAPMSVDAEIEVGVPVTAAYNQFTQFEQFPRFMEGVDEVKQLDDTLLRWAVTVAGRHAEWDAKIIEQEPDRRITWESVDGKRTRGTVIFEAKGPERSRIRMHMSYEPDGTAEKVGSAMGLDSRRVHADLARFREIVEARP
jgi:uncharacterized membrane protein